MARSRRPARARKQQASEAQVIANGVYQVAREIEQVRHPLPLFARAPIQYVCEQMGWAVCKAKGIPMERHPDVAAYLLAGVQEYVVALFGEFDEAHFEEWTAALAMGEQREVRRSG